MIAQAFTHSRSDVADKRSITRPHGAANPPRSQDLTVAVDRNVLTMRQTAHRFDELHVQTIVDESSSGWDAGMMGAHLRDDFDPLLAQR